MRRRCLRRLQRRSTVEVVRPRKKSKGIHVGCLERSLLAFRGSFSRYAKSGIARPSSNLSLAAGRSASLDDGKFTHHSITIITFLTLSSALFASSFSSDITSEPHAALLATYRCCHRRSFICFLRSSPLIPPVATRPLSDLLRRSKRRVTANEIIEISNTSRRS